MNIFLFLTNFFLLPKKKNLKMNKSNDFFVFDFFGTFLL